MDKKGIVNLLASALTTAIGIATADYTATGTIHWAALAHSPWDHANEPHFWEQLRAHALQLRANSDRAHNQPTSRR